VPAALNIANEVIEAIVAKESAEALGLIRDAMSNSGGGRPIRMQLPYLNMVSNLWGKATNLKDKFSNNIDIPAESIIRIVFQSMGCVSNLHAKLAFVIACTVTLKQRVPAFVDSVMQNTSQAKTLYTLRARLLLTAIHDIAVEQNGLLFAPAAGWRTVIPKLIESEFIVHMLASNFDVLFFGGDLADSLPKAWGELLVGLAEIVAKESGTLGDETHLATALESVIKGIVTKYKLKTFIVYDDEKHSDTQQAGPAHIEANPKPADATAIEVPVSAGVFDLGGLYRFSSDECYNAAAFPNLPVLELPEGSVSSPLLKLVCSCIDMHAMQHVFADTDDMPEHHRLKIDLENPSKIWFTGPFARDDIDNLRRPTLHAKCTCFRYLVGGRGGSLGSATRVRPLEPNLRF
jgi:hypothetical protein